MAPLHRTATLLWAVLALAGLFVLAQQQPESAVTYFPNQPSKLFYFDDSQVAIYHSLVDGTVWVSQDEGKSWGKAAGVPEGEAAMVIEHPFDNSIAFILTKDTKHYRTNDRGKTWRSFDVPVRPAFVGQPLSFHSDPKKYGYILYQGTKCEREGPWGYVCHDETYYTKDAFSSEAQLMLSETSRCQFAHSSKDFKHEAHEDLVYCVAFDSSSSTGMHAISSSRLYSSTDFFKDDNRVEDFGIGKNARGVVALAIVSKFAVVAIKDTSPDNNGEMLLYVTVDTKNWAKAKFPHASSAMLRENGYTVVESTTHSLAVDVLLQDMSSIGTLFVSNSNGTFFVESLKDTNRNEMGFVDFETLYGIEGVGIANVVVNAKDVETRRETKQLQSRITFDDGRTWSRIPPPRLDSSGKRISCDSSNADACSLHLYSVTQPHNVGRVFSSPAPGMVMAVGSIGATLRPYEECDTFLSTDAGVTWRMVGEGARLYEFGDSGSILVTVNDEENTNEVQYSLDFGETWEKYTLPLTLRARFLMTVPDSTSQKFTLIGQLSRRDAPSDSERWAVVYLDFAKTRNRQCEDSDFETWYARKDGNQCLMGHKQYYYRRKANAKCYVGNKFVDPVEHEENCPCTDDDYECDYNFIKQGDKCVLAGPEPIPAGVCKANDQKQTYMGSSGYRRIPGNTCDAEKGLKKDEPVERSCAEAQPPEGEVIHQIFEFPSPMQQYSYFRNSRTILVRLADNSIWQSANEGYTWTQLFPEEKFIAFYHHKHSDDRAYLITSSEKYMYTTDTGKTWNELRAPLRPNTFGYQIIHFHPLQSDYLIWTGERDCSGFGENCRVVAHYTRDNGRNWYEIDQYVRNCAWARDAELRIDSTQIICESFKIKEGSQRRFSIDNPLELISGTDFYNKKTKLFDHVVGFAKFSEYFIVAEYQSERHSLDLQVSLDGRTFAAGMFPPTLRLEQHAYTILESSTKSVFLHVTVSEPPAPTWGDILKSNSNGTYFGISVDYVNRNQDGYVDFEKMIGLDGIALVNVVSNPHDAPITGVKEIQTRITHNDGGSWKPLPPPLVDSQGNKYECDSTRCALHVHGFTERFDARATYSTPSVPGLMMAVGNVGEKLAPYTESDTFLSRDAGFTWEEVHKDAHLWEFGDSGSVLVMANDEVATDHVLYSLDEGLTWNEYRFTDDKVRVKAIMTVPSDTSRRFILFGYRPRNSKAALAVHLDFSALTKRKCVLDITDSADDDFELWSPAEVRTEACLFGHRTLYHRRKRTSNCVVGDQEKQKAKFVENCQCKAEDFECEFNYRKDADGNCVLIPGLQPLPNDDSCRNGEEFWYERTAYRKVPISTCEGGKRLDRGPEHRCPGLKGHGFFFWFFVLLVPFMFTALVAYWYYRRMGLARGTIRLPGGDHNRRGFSSDGGLVDTIASIPWYIVGVAGIAWEWVASRFDSFGTRYRARSGYRHVPVDEDAQILRFEDEE